MEERNRFARAAERVVHVIVQLLKLLWIVLKALRHPAGPELARLFTSRPTAFAAAGFVPAMKSLMSHRLQDGA